MGVHPRRAVHGLVLALLMLAVSAPASTAVGFGANMNLQPTNTVTCGQGVFPYYSAPIGSQSCMYFSGSITASPYAPVSGTVTAVHVRVGPVTGLMQVVVMRSLYQNKAGDPGHPYFACCFVERYGPTFTPQPNTVSTIETNLPMTEEPTPPPEDFVTNAAGDFLALSVLAPNVPIPAVSDSTSGYSGFYPAPTADSVPAPSPNPLFASIDGAPPQGFQILISGDLQAGAGNGNAPAGGGAPQGAQQNPVPVAPLLPALGFPRLTLPINKGAVQLPLQCTGADCVGNVLLQNLTQPGATIARAKRHGHRRPKAITYGSGKVDIKAGSKGSVRVKLNRSGRRASRAHRKLRVWANFTLGKTKVSKRVTLTH